MNSQLCDSHRAESATPRRDGTRLSIMNRFHRSEDGTALTEFVITLPCFMILLSGLLMFHDILDELSRIEVVAYQHTANAAMEAQQRGVMDTISQSPDMTHHLRSDFAAPIAAAQFATDAYPARQRSEQIGFRNLYQAKLNRSSHWGEAVFTNTRPPDVANVSRPASLLPLLDEPTDPLMAVQAPLLGHPRYLTYRLFVEDETLPSSGFSVDLTGGVFDNVIGVTEQFVTNLASPHTIAAGARYGVAVREATSELENTFMRFDYQIPFRSHYATALPTNVPDNDASAAALRAVAIGRLRMETMEVTGGGITTRPYANLIRIGLPGTTGAIDPADLLPSIELTAPESADDIFGAPLHY